MKKTLAMLLAATMVVSVAGCGSKTGNTETTAAEATTGAADTETVELEHVSAFDLENLENYIVLGEYKNIEVEKQDITVTDEEVEEELQYQVEYYETDYEQITDRAVADGDVVNIDYEGKQDGVAFDGGTDTGASLTIGAGQFIDGFEEGLIGVMPGETVDLNLSFPEDYWNSDLAGVEVVFTVTVNYIQGEEIANELNDEFVQKITDGEYQTVDEYRAYVRAGLEDDKISTAETAKLNAAWEIIMANATYPNEAEELVQYLYDNEMQSFEETLVMYGMDRESYLEAVEMTEEELEEELNEYVEQLAHSQLAIRAIAEAEGLELTDEMYEEECEALAEELGMTADGLKETYPESMIKDSIYQEMVREIVLNNIVEVESAEEETTEAETVEEAAEEVTTEAESVEEAAEEETTAAAE